MKEFNLSNELEILFKEVEHKHIDYLKELIFEKNREFIRLLKKEIEWSNTDNIGFITKDQIDKLAGDKLNAQEIINEAEGLNKQERVDKSLSKCPRVEDGN